MFLRFLVSDTVLILVHYLMSAFWSHCVFLSLVICDSVYLVYFFCLADSDCCPGSFLSISGYFVLSDIVFIFSDCSYTFS